MDTWPNMKLGSVITANIVVFLVVGLLASCGKGKQTGKPRRFDEMRRQDVVQMLASTNPATADEAYRFVLKHYESYGGDVRQGLSNHTFRVRLGCRNLLIAQGGMTEKEGAQRLFADLLSNRNVAEKHVAALVLSEEMASLSISQREEVVIQLIDGLKDPGVLLVARDPDVLSPPKVTVRDLSAERLLRLVGPGATGI